MIAWTDRQLIGFPAAMLESANQLAALIDPDTGGALTFSADRTRGNHVYAEIPFLEHFLPLVQRRDPDEWFESMTQLAQARGREPLSAAEIDVLCRQMLIGDECNELEVVE